ncbi:MAG: hypothetical protein ICV62_18565, partial [Cyanobacteria bacterium Co-bin13]|nr:hypothetical protein [Cyanobacteria bacterium Co-bin13]
MQRQAARPISVRWLLSLSGVLGLLGWGLLATARAIEPNTSPTPTTAAAPLLAQVSAVDGPSPVPPNEA